MNSKNAVLTILNSTVVINGDVSFAFPDTPLELISLTSALNVLKSDTEALTELNERLQELHVKITRDC